METDSLSCLRSVGASVPFTSLYVLFKIYLLNLNALELWPWLELKRSRMLRCTFSLHLFTWDCFILLLQSKHIELCNTIDFSVHLAETTRRRYSYLRLLSKILLKPQPLFSAAVSAGKKKKVQICIFVFQQNLLQTWTVESQPHFICFCLLESEVRKGKLGLQLPRVCWDRCLCAVESILRCLVLCLCLPKLSWNLIRL